MGVVLFITLAGFPPYAKPDMSDWWFNKLSKGRLDLFWKAHCRSVYFSEAAKDLINKMLAPNPANRISMEAIAQHPWLKGSLISSDVLFNEFQRRKAVVDNVKERERQQKKALQGEIAEGDGVVVRDGGDVVVDPELDDLPPIAPDMAGFLAKAPEEDEQEEEDLEDEDEDLEAPTLPDEQVANVTYSQFTSELSPQDLLYKLKQIITPMARSVNVQKSKFKLDAMVLAGGLTEFQVRVYKTENGSLATFKKTGGNHMPFQALYGRICEKMFPQAEE
jgi:serine/threonine protein kinase